MTSTLTVPLPGRRALLTVGLVLVFGLALWLGLRVVGPLLAAPTNDALSSSSVHEIHTVDGAVYLGTVVSMGSDALLLEAPAVLRPAEADEAETRLVVQALFGDPYDIAGPVAIQRAQVVALGSVAEGSGLADAYDQAVAGRLPAESPSPASGE